MTKPSSIMVCPMVPLRQLSDADRDVLRRVLFDNIQGVDAKHNARWRRWWGRLFNAEAGEVQHIQALTERSMAFHGRHMAIEQRLFDVQDAFVNQDRFRDWLKTGAGWGEYKLVGERTKFVPASLAYEKCSEDEMREFHTNMVDFLHTPRAQRRLWPHLGAQARADMLESALADRKESA
jgi:hypothetical protein